MNYSNYILDKLLCNRSLKKSEIIITGSNTIKKELLAINPKIKKKLNVVYWGSSLKKKKINIKRKKNLLFVGKFEPRKNIRMLLKAYSLLEKRQIHNLYT